MHCRIRSDRPLASVHRARRTFVRLWTALSIALPSYLGPLVAHAALASPPAPSPPAASNEPSSPPAASTPAAPTPTPGPTSEPLPPAQPADDTATPVRPSANQGASSQPASASAAGATRPMSGDGNGVSTPLDATTSDGLPPTTSTEIVSQTSATPPAANELAMDVELESLLSESVVAGASRAAERSSEAPALVYSITGSQLARYNIQDLSEAFNYLSLGVYAEIYDNSIQPSLGGRGLAFNADEGNHFLFVLDGHFVNNPGNGVPLMNDWGALPMESIDRIEIILGPGSVLYGSNAMLGVINVVTKKGKDMSGLTLYANGNLAPVQDQSGLLTAQDSRYWGRDQRLSARYGRSFTLGGKSGSIVVQAQYRDDRSIGFIYGPQYRPGAEASSNWGDKTVGGNPAVWYGHSSSRTRTVGAYGKFNLGNTQLTLRHALAGVISPAYASRFNDQDGVFLYTANHGDLRHEWTLSTKVGAMTRMYGDYWRVNSDFTINSVVECFGRGAFAAPCRIPLRSEQWRTGAEAQVNVNWLSDGRLVSLVGVDARYRGTVVRSDPQDIALGTKFGTIGAIDKYAMEIAAYAQQIYRPIEKLSLNAGVRYDHFDDSSALSPRAALVVMPWQGSSLKLSYSQAFRAATDIEELLEFPKWMVPAGKLRPERVRGLDLNLTQMLGPHRLTLGGFGSQWLDMIGVALVADPTDITSRLHMSSNLTEIWNAGGNAAWELAHDQWDVGLNVTAAWSRARIRGGKNGVLSAEELDASGFSAEAVERFGRYQPLEAAPALFGNARVSYALGADLPTLSAALHFAGPRYVVNTYGTPMSREVATKWDSGRVGARVRGRATVTGNVPGSRFEGWRYHLSLDVNSNTQAAGLIGPVGTYYVGDGSARLQRLQIPRLSIFGGLSYSFQ